MIDVIPAVEEMLENTPPSAEDAQQFSSNKADISDEESTQMLLFMLKKEMGPEAFMRMIEEHATDMEVYGLIDSAEKAKAFVTSMKEHMGKDKKAKAIMMLALKRAIAEGDPSAQAFIKAEEEERKALDNILEEYGAEARRSLALLIDNCKRKVLVMQGPFSRELMGILDNLAD